MHKRYLILALVLLAAAAMPALAAENDPVAEETSRQWQTLQQRLSLLLQERALLLERDALHKAQLAAMREKCGAPCQEPPQAKAEPVHPVPPGQ